MKQFGIDAPYETMGPIRLEPSRSTKDAPPLIHNIEWLIGTQTHRDTSAMLAEWERIIRSVAILARAEPTADIDEIFDTAIIWERG